MVKLIERTYDMDGFKTLQKKNDLKQFIIDNYADLIGSGISGTLSLFSVVDPFVGFLAGHAGVIVSGTLKGIGKDVKERQLSPQEDLRVGKVLAIAALEIHQRLEKGESLRKDGFFDKKPNERSDAEEIAEAIMLKCQREPQEKKILYMGYLLAGIALDSNISADMGHQLIKAAEELTYRQLCILKLAVVKHQYGLRNQDYQNHEGFTKELYQVLQECHDLCLKSYLDYKIPITFKGQISIGYINIQPNKMIIYGIGEDLFHLMKLPSIPDEDIIPIAEVLK